MSVTRDEGEPDNGEPRRLSRFVAFFRHTRYEEAGPFCGSSAPSTTSRPALPQRGLESESYQTWISIDSKVDKFLNLKSKNKDFSKNRNKIEWKITFFLNFTSPNFCEL